MIVELKGFPAESYVRPDDEIPPELKEESKYNLDFCKFIYGQYLNGNSGVKLSEQEQIKLNRQYAAGRQDPNIYRDNLVSQNQPNFVGDREYDSLLKHRETMLSVDFTKIFSPIPKMIMGLQGIIEKTEHKIVTSAIDEKSTSLKRQLKWQRYVDGQFKPFFDYVNAAMSVPGESNKALPQTIEEMELLSNIGEFKLAYEIAMQFALTATAGVSKNKKVKRRIVYDLLSNGMASTYSYADLGGVVKYQYIDFTNLIIEDCTDEDFSDATWGGMCIWMTIADLRARLNIEEKELKKLAVTWNKSLDVSYATQRSDGSFAYDGFRVPVLHSYWKSVNSKYTTYFLDESGRQIDEPWRKSSAGKWMPPRAYKREYKSTEVHNQRYLYSAKWIIGTEYVYDYGKVTDIPFDYHAKDVKLPFHVYRIPGKPLVESMIPIEDQIQYTYLELQNARSKAAPSGLKIEISSIENVKIGKKTLHPLDVIKIRTQTGHMLYRLAPPAPGNPIGVQNPIEEILGGYEPAITSAVKSLELYYMEMERITGIADVATGKSPEQDQGLGVTKIALNTTNDTLSPIYTGWISIKEDQAQYDAVKIHSHILGVNDIDSPYYEMLGPAMFHAIKGAGPYPPVFWGIEIKAKIDEFLKQKIITAAENALAVGKDGVPILSYSEYMFVVDKIQDDENIDYIRAYIAYKERKAAEAADKKARMIQQDAIKGKQETDALAAKAKLDEATTLSKLKVQEDTNLTLNKAKLLATEYDLMARLELVKMGVMQNIWDEIPSQSNVRPPIQPPMGVTEPSAQPVQPTPANQNTPVMQQQV